MNRPNLTLAQALWELGRATDCTVLTAEVRAAVEDAAYLMRVVNQCLGNEYQRYDKPVSELAQAVRVAIVGD